MAHIQHVMNVRPRHMRPPWVELCGALMDLWHLTLKETLKKLALASDELSFSSRRRLFL